MYAKIPENLKDPLLKELRRCRLGSAVKTFPALVIIFSAFAILAIMVKGHAIIEMLRDLIPSSWPDSTFTAAALVAIVVFTAAALVYFLRQEYRDCKFQECFYCSKCDAVDNFDSGCCPVCQNPLAEKASFYFTIYKNEEKIIQRWGLQPSKEA